MQHEVATPGPTPTLKVCIVIGTPEHAKAEGYEDEFRVEGDTELMRQFFDWWHANRMDNVVSHCLAQGQPFTLFDEPDGTGGYVPAIGDYLNWRDSVEERELVAA